MLFNSYEFIFGFAPLALGGFFLFGRVSRLWALRWIILASVGFYAWWRPLNVLIIAPSIIVNYFLARAMLRFGAQGRRRASIRVLALGVAFNVAFLGYFKYANFALGAVNDAFGTRLALARIVLPLGISFITFQKIAFLIDVYAGRVESFAFQDYCLFVLFFPQLIAGPIVHYREMMPQFQRAACAPEPENLAVGVTLFACGLFKKVVLADGIAPLVSPLFGAAAAGKPMSLLPAWLAALGFTFQIYFDFSGYTDMALGLARCFGVRFPPNFDSPLKASSIIDFWLRWHMTLTRFLTAYIYNPLALRAARRRAARGLAGFGGRNTTVGAYLEVLAVPVMITMFVSGLWHGAGYLFVLWGLVHGVYIAINHAWRIVGSRLWRDRAACDRTMQPIGFALTFVAVVAAMVLFRSPTLPAAADLLRGMAGANGILLPSSLYGRIGHLPTWLRPATAASAGFGDLSLLAAWTAGLGVVALALPNTLQVLARYQPALGIEPSPSRPSRIRALLTWSPSLAWAVAVSVIAAIAVLHLGGNSEFLYWQF